ncbi:hypothetical protein GJ496_010593 [Pomphorhynchus laevis]|nr:hypothetical protein GJ496_010593 [Pomphorhynchus laevis]
MDSHSSARLFNIMLAVFSLEILFTALATFGQTEKPLSDHLFPRTHTDNVSNMHKSTLPRINCLNVTMGALHRAFFECNPFLDCRFPMCGSICFDCFPLIVTIWLTPSNVFRILF